MSSRGRGGRGGRGGVSKSLTRDQLTSMGVGTNESLPGPVTQPPPLYALMDRKPVCVNPSMELEYLLILRQDFIDNMQLSGSYLKLPESKNRAEQEIDKLVAQIPSTKEKYDWSLFPSELRPKILAKRMKKKVVKEVNIEQKLSLLEELEQKVNDDDKKTNNDENDNDDEEIEETEVADEDEEMDDGTDYANNYFDNGEDYEDEDDNLEDGPIY